MTSLVLAPLSSPLLTLRLPTSYPSCSLVTEPLGPAQSTGSGVWGGVAQDVSLVKAADGMATPQRAPRP